MRATVVLLVTQRRDGAARIRVRTRGCATGQSAPSRPLRTRRISTTAPTKTHGRPRRCRAQERAPLHLRAARPVPAHAETLSAEVVKLKEAAEATAAQLAATERTHTEVRQQWAAKLEQAQHDFSADMLTRDDLEAMRLQLIEQTEAPWKAKVKTLEGEVSASRESAAQYRREAERARASLDAAAHEQRAALREAEVRHETLVAELRAKVELLESTPGGKVGTVEEGAERMRRLQREHAEATVRSQKLLEEVDELRRENDGLVQVRAELLAAHATLQGEGKAKERLSNAEKASLERKVSHMQHELDASNAAQQRMHEAALHTETEMRSLRAAVDEAQHAVATERSSAALRLSEAQREVSHINWRWTVGRRRRCGGRGSFRSLVMSSPRMRRTPSGRRPL